MRVEYADLTESLLAPESSGQQDEGAPLLEASPKGKQRSTDLIVYQGPFNVDAFVRRVVSAWTALLCKHRLALWAGCSLIPGDIAASRGVPLLD